ncbi:MAG: hypothetical protein ABIN89_06645 [Chitinophagaceae bacterium]
MNPSLGDKSNLIFKGTSVEKGNAKAIVTRTGIHTELGKITQLVEDAMQEDTQLEKKRQGLTGKLMWITDVFASIFIIKGLLQGKECYLIIETSLALAIAAIPKGCRLYPSLHSSMECFRWRKKMC